MCCLVYRYHCCAEAVFTEGGVLVAVFFVAAAQFVDDGTAQCSFAFTVDEDNTLAFAVAIVGEYLAEGVELVLQHLAITHAGSAVEQLVDVQIYLDDLGRLLLGLARLLTLG